MEDAVLAIMVISHATLGGPNDLVGGVHRGHRRQDGRIVAGGDRAQNSGARRTASGSLERTVSHPVMSACSRRKTGFFVPPPQVLMA